jgi:serine-type D-Ala-D-Ala carboxypeptidase (penicillin-binding protein 5/6)
MKVVQLKYFFILLFCICSSAFADFPTIPPTPTLPAMPTAAIIIPTPPTLAAKSYILIDYLSDHVIAQQDIDQRLEPASLTKMMTVYVADHALRSNKIKFTDMVQVSERAWRAIGSRMFLDLNSKVSVAELLKGIIIQSGNDASIALAEHIAGSESAFSELMNYFAKELGMTNTHFVNVTGLPEPNHYTSARDMAILAKALIRDFPETYSLYSQKEFTYKTIKQTNRNRLLWQNDSVDGIKTGHTESAGYCLVASGQKEGMRLIAVVMGTQNDAIRTNETNKLLTYGFRFFETRKIYPAGTSIQLARVYMGKEKEINLGLAQDLYITLGRGQFDELKASINVDKIIKAPIIKSKVLGSIVVQMDNKTIIERPMVALNDIQQANFMQRSYDYLALTCKSLWNKVSS